MSLKKINPRTPSLRHVKLVQTSPDFKKNSPVKALTESMAKSGGRNNQGKITSFQRGSGVKQRYRRLDLKRATTQGIVEKIEYDPNRTGWIGRLFDVTHNVRTYILASHELRRGDYVQSGKNVALRPSNALPLDQVPIGFLLYNVGLTPTHPGQLARSGGTCCQLIQKTSTHGRLQLPSGEHRLVPLGSQGSIGVVSNGDHRLEWDGKAGRARWKNRRPHVRGVAMNPVDHPHGGGEGKTSGGRPSVTPWGKPTKGWPTTKYKTPSRWIVKARKK